ncbi:hypothetical protein KR200_004357, partial [Drosophila serrata]
MKVISKTVAIRSAQTADFVRDERLALEVIQGKPFLACLQYAFQDIHNLYFVMNFAQGGELFRLLLNVDYFSEANARIYIAELVVALRQLHRRNIIYRDLKLENILLDHEGHIVLADLGLATFLTRENQRKAYSVCGSLQYMAPEMLRAGEEGYGKAVDWWSLGVVTVELLTGINPFSRPTLPRSELAATIQRRILEEDPHISMPLSPMAVDLISQLLEKNPEQRLNGNRIREHPFFEGMDWSEIPRRNFNMPYLPTITAPDDVQNF